MTSLTLSTNQMICHNIHVVGITQCKLNVGINASTFTANNSVTFKPDEENILTLLDRK